TIVVDFTLDADTPLGTPVISTLEATIPLADANTNNNVSELADIVVGAFDPNDIQVSLSRINPGMVADEVELEYRIRFQNTGNYPADRVVVRNKIAEGLNLSSIRGIVTSHPVAVERMSSRELAFVFDNIQLPDSTSNESESHGFITYRIRVEPSLLLGDTIPNQAAIFFDFNAPVITNIATTAVDDFTGIRQPFSPETALTVFPNPVRTDAWLTVGAPAAEQGDLYVYDVLGRCRRIIRGFDPSRDRLSTANLSKGPYWLVLDTETRWWQGRVLVQ
ncbi:MAG: T9SS type A sorting domain-containing protein, partial [Lewinella sp.]|nr:T9SS type A sorting domain-containing protein [Lewinella sp.]